MSRDQRQTIISAITAGFLTNAVAFGCFLWFAGGKVAVGQQTLDDHGQRITAVEGRVEKEHDTVADVKADVREMKSDLKWLTKWAGKEEKKNP